MVAESTARQSAIGPRLQQLPEAVAAHVVELILSGGLRPGDFLRMEPIAEALGVSNTPVREGLVALSSQGFIRQIPRRGFVVAPFTRQDIRDLFWAQAFLAGELAARAAVRIVPKQLNRLEGIDNAYHDAVAANDHYEVAQLGHAFHREINLAADSIRLARLLGSVMRTLPPKFSSTEGGIEASQGEHPEIIATLRERNARRSRILMKRHILGGADRLIDILERRGLWTGTGEV